MSNPYKPVVPSQRRKPRGLGFVNRVVGEQSLDETVEEIAAELVEKSALTLAALTLAATKLAVNAAGRAMVQAQEPGATPMYCSRCSATRNPGASPTTTSDVWAVAEATPDVAQPRTAQAWSTAGTALCDALPALGSYSKPVGWERLFWGVVERSRNPIAVFDQGGSHLAVNAATCEFFGVSRDEFDQSQLGYLLTPAERSTLEDEWRELWAKRDLSGVRVFTRVDGSQVRLQYAARTAVVDGRRVAVVVVIRQERAHEFAPVGQAGGLTRREREVVSLVALGLTSPEIAEKLCISQETARTHVRNSMAKLNARTRAHLVAIALADGQIEALPETPPPVPRS